MKREKSRDAIKCNPDYGPIFGNDIRIDNKCNKRDSCLIDNTGTHGYECNPKHRYSLFVNKIIFSVLDYEVFGIDYENKENINKLCEYPGIIMEYIETKCISEESLKQLDDDTELLNDLDIIHIINSHVLLKISQYYLKSPSSYLPNTHIVSQQYDSYLKEWLGKNTTWRLLYRASEHDYTGTSFHECCNNKGPTLVIIKSTEGWIFGGFTNEDWIDSSIFV